MSTLQQFGIDKLSVEARLELIGEIWDSITDDGTAFVMPEWHKAILAERLAEADANPGVGTPWRDVMDNLGKK